jgi:hypothetical protein|tara:strand:- start:17194 stop:17379 length:186 start_codon:yes stop_codon:yes gene_type:complete
MEKILNESQLNLLRKKGIITNQEIALIAGDLFVAEDVVTRKRRVINEAESVLDESKRLLKG